MGALDVLGKLDFIESVLSTQELNIRQKLTVIVATVKDIEIKKEKVNE